MGFQYDPERVWFLFNTSYNNTSGFGTGSVNLGGREELYFIGNVIYDCNNGMLLNGVAPSDPSVIAANTIYDCTDGIYNGYYTCKLAIENNILSCSRYYINFPPDYATATNSDFGRNLVYGGSGFVWGGATYWHIGRIPVRASEGVGSVEADPLFVSSSDLRLAGVEPGCGCRIWDRRIADRNRPVRHALRHRHPQGHRGESKAAGKRMGYRGV